MTSWRIPPNSPARSVSPSGPVKRWGDRWLAGGAGPAVVYRHHACGEFSHVELTCSHCGQPIGATDIDVVPGPGVR